MDSVITVATLTGLVNLLQPELARITPAAIAHGLARNNRWAGATSLPLTVAQHSLLVFELACRLHPGQPALRIMALLHDAHEYLIGDIITPVGRALQLLSGPTDPSILPPLAVLKLRIDFAIAQSLDTPMVAHRETPLGDTLERLDTIARAVEWSLLPAANGPCPYGIPPAGAPRSIKPLAWPDAEERYLTALTRELAGRRWEQAA